ncbi:unnamed protein product, partial [Allacma fusca]
NAVVTRPSQVKSKLTKLSWRQTFKHTWVLYTYRRKMEPALCSPLTQSMKILALISILASLTVASVSSLMLHRSVQLERSPTKTTAKDLLSQVNVFFGGMIGIYDLDIIFRILKGCSATALVGGLLQFLMSFWLLMASVREGKRMALAWVGAHIAVLIAIGGSFICILTTELQFNIAVRVFLPITGIDSLLIIYFCIVVCNFSQRDGVVHGSRGRMNIFKSRKKDAHGTGAISSSRSFNVEMTESSPESRDEWIQKQRKTIIKTERIKHPAALPLQTRNIDRAESDSESSTRNTALIKTDWAKDVHFPVPKRDTVAVAVSRETDF